ncbi:flagellar biosynthesis protein FlhF [Paenibacillus lemnae]|uniref:Flagellar biosynthesis protein FlhF n=1 Tax=Paenibacillus lemnae TaxID=1330551 RepID=A0A848M605_PAELE|nr:flagellar biosynthesis protein FlhF [Paenibacillus lemnae]NMO96175.1 flagellar biosynthesis protein FlhF [Paenibacillus lemnae]
MRVRRYVVDTMPEAMLSIRKDLGGEAVILSSKEIKVGGFLGMFATRKIEVIAAIEKEDAPKPKPEGSIKQPQPQVPRNALSKAYKKSEAPSKPTQADQAGESFAQDFIAAAAAEPNPIQAERLDLTQTDEKRLASEQHLLHEIREVKDWIAKLSRQSSAQEDWPEGVITIRDHLNAQGLSSSLVETWIQEVLQEWKASGGSMSEQALNDSFLRQAERFLEGRFGGGIRQDTRMVYIAGPTGVGKTTTIAKLAAEQLFKYQRKVGFITSDTYRISAVEQLKTYASILNVPIEVVQSPGDMQRAMQRLESCDLILMDTAGRNYRNEMFVSELQSLLPGSPNSETYLVLSLTSKSSDMLEITGHFSKFVLDKVIFTKLDETGSCGALFNLLAEHSLQLSYMTNGQNVPDDLLMPDMAMLTSLLFGRDLHE